MKILYDMSVLGLGHRLPRARTGIFRVVEKVAEELVKIPDCDVTFISNQYPENLYDCGDYLTTNAAFRSVPLSKPKDFDKAYIVQRKKLALISELMQDKTIPTSQRLKKKFQVRQLWLNEKFLSKIPKNLISPTDQANADIFHSPFYPLPPQSETANYKAVFLTCYDLIPVLHPEFFEAGPRENMLNILNSLTPESWVVCISHATRNDLLNYMGNKLRPERVIVTPLAASSDFYQSLDKAKNLATRANHGIPDKPYILSLCTFEPRKNIDQVVRAFAKLIQEQNISDLNLVLVGVRGWKFDKIFEEIAGSEHLKDRIIITGFVADADLAAIYSDAQFFVYPSFYEGFGLPPLEAMQCGIPVITSSTSSLPEVVGDAGIMVSPRDLDELCDAMLKLYTSSSLRAEMVQKSLEQAKLFSWKHCAEETASAYRTALKA